LAWSLTGLSVETLPDGLARFSPSLASRKLPSFNRGQD